MQTAWQALLLVVALAISIPAWAEFTGRVVGAADGDTITVSDADRRLHKVRLAGIDAPERGQAFGFRSKEYLAKWVYDRDVMIKGDRKHRQASLVGYIFVDGHDAGLEQLRADLAWWHRAYAGEQAAKDREAYELTEKTARASKLSLWRDANPVPP